jgi:hypothetical protein
MLDLQIIQRLLEAKLELPQRSLTEKELKELKRKIVEVTKK